MYVKTVNLPPGINLKDIRNEYLKLREQIRENIEKDGHHPDDYCFFPTIQHEKEMLIVEASLKP